MELGETPTAASSRVIPHFQKKINTFKALKESAGALFYEPYEVALPVRSRLNRPSIDAAPNGGCQRQLRPIFFTASKKGGLPAIETKKNQTCLIDSLWWTDFFFLRGR